MAGKPTGPHERARKAYENSGCSLSVKAMMKRFKVSQSTAYRIIERVREEQRKKATQA